MKSILLSLICLLLVAQTFSQKAFVEEDEIDVDARAAMNRKPVSNSHDSGMEMESFISKKKQVVLQERFLGGALTDGVWRDRADLTLWYDQNNRLIKVDISNHSQNKYAETMDMDLESLFGAMCEQNSFY